MLESLIKGGALDGARGGGAAAPAMPAAGMRPRLLAALDGAVDYGNRHQRDRDKGQAQLFGGADDGRDRAGRPRRCRRRPPWTEAQHLAFEKEALGLYLSGHPIDRHKADLEAYGAKSLADLLAAQEPLDAADDEEAPGGPPPPPARISEDVSVGGIVASIRQLKTRKGDRMAAFMLEDPHGTVEVVVFPEAFSKAAALIQADALVLVKGRFERDEDSTRLLAAEVLPIEAVRAQITQEVLIHVSTPPPRPADVRAGARRARAAPRRPPRRVHRHESPTRRRRCASAWTCPASCACGRRTSSWPTWSRSAGPGRSSCGRIRADTGDAMAG